MRIGMLTTTITLTAGIAQAAVIDNMDSTSNFSSAFGAASVSATGGIGTLSKTSGDNVDSGVIWSDAGAVKIPLTAPLVTITPDTGTQDYINVNTIYFDTGGAYVGQLLSLADTNTNAQINFDVSAGSLPAGADSYVLQIRILPYGSADAAYRFDSIVAVPEPASLSGLLLGATLLRRRRA